MGSSARTLLTAETSLTYVMITSEDIMRHTRDGSGITCVPVDTEVPVKWQSIYGPITQPKSFFFSDPDHDSLEDTYMRLQAARQTCKALPDGKTLRLILTKRFLFLLQLLFSRSCSYISTTTH